VTLSEIRGGRHSSEVDRTPNVFGFPLISAFPQDPSPTARRHAPSAHLTHPGCLSYGLHLRLEQKWSQTNEIRYK
jgi:hypothetical protein